MTLLSASPNGLQNLLNVCSHFSSRWRLKFSPDKCWVVVFHGKGQKVNNNYQWMYGNVKLQQKLSVTHIGVELCGNFGTSDIIMAKAKKLRQLVVTTLGLGEHGDKLNAVSGVTILKSVCFTSALHACELFTGLSNSDYTLMQRQQNLAVKLMQGLHFRTRSDMANSLLGLVPIQAFISKCKLQFLGRLCNMSLDKACKKVFLTRLLTYKLCGAKQFGFVAEVMLLVQRYGLQEYCIRFMEKGEFPDTHIWKKIVHRAVLQTEEKEWKNRMEEDYEFDRFKRVHSKLHISVWRRLARKYKSYEKYVFQVIKLITTRNAGDLTFHCCPKCGAMFSDIVQHIIIGCLFIQDSVNEMWDNIINAFPVEFTVQLHQLEDDEFVLAVLGAVFQHDLDDSQYEMFLLMCAKHIGGMVDEYQFFDMFAHPL